MQKEKDFVTMEEGFQYFTTMHPPISEEERIRILKLLEKYKELLEK